MHKTKVGKTAPLLLPPRDYDTVHRGRGNLHDIDERRAVNPAIVGEAAREAAAKAARESNAASAAVTKSSERGLLAGGSSSEQSSGIGSEERGNLTHSPQLLAERFSSGKFLREIKFSDVPCKVNNCEAFFLPLDSCVYWSL